MKNTIIKPFLFGLFAASLLSLQTSCNSCEGNRDTEAEDSENNIYNRQDGMTNDTIANQNRGNTTGATGNGSTTRNSGNQTTGNTTNNNDGIENSRSDAYDKEGKPASSGGSMGSGMGTGTGSTGNNSKVTDPKDQYN